MTEHASQADLARDDHDHEEHDHPGAVTYLIVAGVLTVLTALEVAIFYIPALSVAIVPLLLTLTTGKFVLVVMFYMHLKMDSRIFTGVFLAPLALAMFLVVALIVLFKVLPAYA
jgi:cytochrome c oxidase subunit 4